MCVMSFMAAVLCELPNKFRCITTMTNKVLFYSVLFCFLTQPYEHCSHDVFLWANP